MLFSEYPNLMSFLNYKTSFYLSFSFITAYFVTLLTAYYCHTPCESSGSEWRGFPIPFSEGGGFAAFLLDWLLFGFIIFFFLQVFDIVYMRLYKRMASEAKEERRQD